MPRELVLFVSRLLARHRKELGIRKNTRSLGCYRQALFGLGTRVRELRVVGVGEALKTVF